MRAKELSRGRIDIRLRGNESALIIDKDQQIRVMGKSHLHILGPLAGVLLADNKKLAEDVQKNYKDLIEKQNAELSKNTETKDEGVENEDDAKGA